MKQKPRLKVCAICKEYDISIEIILILNIYVQCSVFSPYKKKKKEGRKYADLRKTIIDKNIAD